MTDHEKRFLAEDRGAIFSAAIGLARLALQNGEAAKALAYLDDACDDVDARWRDALVKDGHDAELIERFLGPPATSRSGPPTDTPNREAESAKSADVRERGQR